MCTWADADMVCSHPLCQRHLKSEKNIMYALQYSTAVKENVVPSYDKVVKVVFEN